MNKKTIGFGQRYGTALRQYLTHGHPASLRTGLALGREAVVLKLETLELARIHERALITLRPVYAKNGGIKRAEIFFTEAMSPIVETYRAARQSRINLSRLKGSLVQRTQELAATNRQLQRGVLKRKVMQNAAERSGERHRKSLAQSLELQKRLRQLAHRVIAAQELERKKISRELQDEIAQALLGINVRLLSLKHEARTNIQSFKKDIASTRRLVASSVRSVRQVGRKIRGS